MHTIESILTKAFIGLANQGWRKASNGGHSCSYLTKSGLRCGVGVLIDPAGRETELRELGVYVRSLGVDSSGKWCTIHIYGNRRSELLAKYLNEERIPATPEIRELLNKLQLTHDNSESPMALKEAVQYLCVSYNVPIPVV